MLFDKDLLEEQLSQNCDQSTREIYRFLANAKLPRSMTVRPSQHGYISRELHFEVGGKWYFSAVLNQSWVLWYFRRPLLANLKTEPEELLELFPASEITGCREVKLRITNQATADAVCEWLCQHY